MPRCNQSKRPRHVVIAGRKVRLTKEVIRLMERKLRHYIRSQGFRRIRDIDRFARLLCLF